MNARVDHVLFEALALAPEDRLRVALSLLDSLAGDGSTDDEVVASWVAEARRRNEELSSGRAAAMTVDEFQGWFKTL